MIGTILAQYFLGFLAIVTIAVKIPTLFIVITIVSWGVVIAGLRKYWEDSNRTMTLDGARELFVKNKVFRYSSKIGLLCAGFLFCAAVYNFTGQASTPHSGVSQVSKPDTGPSASAQQDVVTVPESDRPVMKIMPSKIGNSLSGDDKGKESFGSLK